MIYIMGKAKKNGKMDHHFKGSMLKVKRMALVFTNGLILQCILVIGQTTR